MASRRLYQQSIQQSNQQSLQQSFQQQSVQQSNQQSVQQSPKQSPQKPALGSISSTFRAKNVDFCIKENGFEHHTWRYELMNRSSSQARLVIRRGQDFYVNIITSCNYNPVIDDILVMFTLDGVQHSIYGLNYAIATPSANEKELTDVDWKCEVVAYTENSMKLKITPSAKAIIGKWTVAVGTKLRSADDIMFEFDVDNPIYLICNPWCQDDLVYLANEDERREYVLADMGLIWRGEYDDMQAGVWNYAQFDRDILDCAMYLLTKIGKVPMTGRNDPVVITRCLSAAINSNDDNGVIIGNWTDNYSGGIGLRTHRVATYEISGGQLAIYRSVRMRIAPTQWIGSRTILQEYYKTKKPVKWGQCWVYGGLLTTVCRALGIPCRTVTNFKSAHDRPDRNAHYSLTIDSYVDEKGNTLKGLSSDDVWNFHVWNEVWMKRMDLAKDFDGWQVIDATPLESGEEGCRVGPASVAAIKRGEVQQSYDVSFIFAEVNADRLVWRYNGPRKAPKLLSKDTTGIGRNISTKAVGKWEREDLTHNYKFPEHSQAERDAFMAALLRCGSSVSRYYLDECFKDIKFEFELKKDIIIGQPLNVVLLMKNQSVVQSYKVSVNLHVHPVTYTGRKGHCIKTSECVRTVQSGATEKVVLQVSWEEYSTRILDQASFNVSCLAAIKDIDFEYYKEEHLRVKKPNINIKLDSKPIIGEQLKATAHFINPLPVPLKCGEFIIDGPGLEEHLKIKISKHVKAGAEVLQYFCMTPKFVGSATIVAKFHSEQLDDVDGLIDFVVRGDTEGQTQVMLA